MSPGARGGVPLTNGGLGLGEHSSLREVIECLQQLEKSIFDRVQQYLWWKILVPRVAHQRHISKVRYMSWHARDCLLLWTAPDTLQCEELFWGTVV